MKSPTRFLRSKDKTGRHGMTLIEVMVAAAISGLVVLGTVSFFIQALNIYHYDSGKLKVNRDIRKLTSEMTDSATYANYALIYPSFSARTKIVTVTNPDTGVTTTSGVPLQVEDGQSGDMLVLVYVDPADDTKIQRMVGYFRAPANPNDPASEGPVRRFDTTFSPTSSSAAVDLLPSVASMNTWPEVIELSRGLSEGRLFHNFYGRSVMIRGQIFHSGDLNRRATNTYNFTISPRG